MPNFAKKRQKSLKVLLLFFSLVILFDFICRICSAFCIKRTIKLMCLSDS